MYGYRYVPDHGEDRRSAMPYVVSAGTLDGPRFFQWDPKKDPGRGMRQPFIYSTII